jgi:hypothetical protein
MIGGKLSKKSLTKHYTQRILEDFYDDPVTVEALLKSKNRPFKP